MSTYVRELYRMKVIPPFCIPTIGSIIKMFRNIFKYSWAKPRLNNKISDIFIRQTTETTEQTPNSRPSAYSFQITTSNLKEERRQFDNMFPMILKDLIHNVKHWASPNLTDWYTRMLEYNVLTGKLKLGFSVILAYKLLEDPQKLTPENIRLARIMAWCLELLTASLLVSDDIIDQSEKRHGIPCWYRLPDVGMSAVNDAIVLEKSAYTILRKYFHGHSRYMPMVDLFHDTIMNMGMGLVLEHITSSNLDLFSMERYRTIVLYKTACFAFQFPVSMAMHLAGIEDTEVKQEASAILVELGHWIQVKNDFEDCFGYGAKNCKEMFGDIRAGKCTWPAVVALERATSEQRAVLERCYGHPDDQNIQAVMDIYTALNIPSLFASYETETRATILNAIEHINPVLSKQIFYYFMEKI